MTLEEALPREFREYEGTPAFALRHHEVVSEYHSRETSSTRKSDIPQHVAPWPGKHKNVYYWVVLSSGHKVGWNENPSTGWSFPVINPSKQEREQASARQTEGWFRVLRGEEV